jgi:hypothetical protein
VCELDVLEQQGVTLIVELVVRAGLYLGYNERQWITVLIEMDYLA